MSKLDSFRTQGRVKEVTSFMWVHCSFNMTYCLSGINGMERERRESCGTHSGEYCRVLVSQGRQEMSEQVCVCQWVACQRSPWAPTRHAVTPEQDLRAHPCTRAHTSGFSCPIKPLRVTSGHSQDSWRVEHILHPKLQQSNFGLQ